MDDLGDLGLDVRCRWKERDVMGLGLCAKDSLNLDETWCWRRICGCGRGRPEKSKLAGKDRFQIDGDTNCGWSVDGRPW